MRIPRSAAAAITGGKSTSAAIFPKDERGFAATGGGGIGIEIGIAIGSGVGAGTM